MRVAMLRIAVFLIYFIAVYFAIYFSEMLLLGKYVTASIVAFLALAWYFVDVLAKSANYKKNKS
jgi:hypothetical protein